MPKKASVGKTNNSQTMRMTINIANIKNMTTRSDQHQITLAAKHFNAIDHKHLDLPVTALMTVW